MRFKKSNASYLFWILDILASLAVWTVGVYAIGHLLGGNIVSLIGAILLVWFFPFIACVLAIWAAISELHWPVWMALGVFLWKMIFILLLMSGAVVADKTSVSKV